jgi:acetyltransferase-like isoleucine patch superfamily enzyme
LISLTAWIKQIIREQRLRKRFPRSVIHAGAVADRNSVLGEHSVLFCKATLLDSILGAYSYVQSGTVVCNVEIGAFCSIASGVNIGLGAHPTFMVSTNPVFYDHEQPLPKFFTRDRLFTQIFPRTTIGADVWIGQGAMIKAGVKIGTGAVIGAGSVVVKDIPPYAIAVGNPCRPIKLRFSEDICQRLFDSRWWEFDKAKLEKLAPLFSDPELFLAALEHDK